MTLTPRRGPLLVASILLAVSCVGFLLGAGLPKDSIYRYLNVFAEVYSLVRGNYVDPPDEDNLLDGAYRGMVGGLDLFSGYLSRDEFQKIKVDPNGGPAETGIEVLRVPGGAMIVAIAPGSQAEKLGIRPTDQIWSIEGVPTRQMALIQLRRAQRGSEDSIVRMLIYHPKTQKREDLRIRRLVPTAPAIESRVLDGKIGYLKIGDLPRTTPSALKSALTTLKQKGATKLLVDLRGCAVGSVEDAVRVAGSFLPTGPVVSVRERGGALVEKDTKGSPVWTSSIFVLENAGSAGGAEVLAAALHARLKAQLLGETTYGWGATQELIALPSGDGLVLSSAKLLSPSGESWNKTGLKPDKEILSTPDERSGVEPDGQLRKALDVLKTPAAKAA